MVAGSVTVDVRHRALLLQLLTSMNSTACNASQQMRKLFAAYEHGW